MARLIFVPQLPVRMRYPEWWIKQFPNNLIDYFDQVLTLDGGVPSQMVEESIFADPKSAIKFELRQIDQYMRTHIQPNDVLLLADISFPGLFANALFHKPAPKMYVMCHATALNKHDYYWGFDYDYYSKFLVELGQMELFNTVFVATNYHRRKIRDEASEYQGPLHMETIALPPPPFKPRPGKRIYDVVSVARPTKQKVTKSLEDIVESKYPITRRRSKSWENYYKFLGQSKILLITAKEETFGYQVLDAVLNGCIPVAPNRLSYPELLPPEYLYNFPTVYKEGDDILEVVERAFDLPVPKLLNQDKIYNFYSNIAKEMLDG